MLADITDLLARSPEDLSAEQQTWASTKLIDAENLLITRVPRLGGDPALLSDRELANARAVICDAVLRLLVNPQGLISEGAGPFRAEFRKNDTGTTGLYFTEDELALFATKRKRRVGMIGVAPSPWGRGGA